MRATYSILKKWPGREARAQQAVKELAAEGQPFDFGHVYSRLYAGDMSMAERIVARIIKDAIADGSVVEIRDPHGPMWVGAQGVEKLDRRYYRLPEQSGGEVKGDRLPEQSGGEVKGNG